MTRLNKVNHSLKTGQFADTRHCQPTTQCCIGLCHGTKAGDGSMLALLPCCRTSAAAADIDWSSWSYEVPACARLYSSALPSSSSFLSSIEDGWGNLGGPNSLFSRSSSLTPVRLAERYISVDWSLRPE